MFDIYFSNAHGFEIDFPFLHFWISSATFYVVVTVVVAWNAKKFFANRKSNQIESVAPDFEWD